MVVVIDWDREFSEFIFSHRAGHLTKSTVPTLARFPSVSNFQPEGHCMVDSSKAEKFPTRGHLMRDLFKAEKFPTNPS